MNRKQFIILLIFVIALGGLGSRHFWSQNASWSRGSAGAGRKLLGDFPVNDVAALVVKYSTNELDLVKKDNLWRVAQRYDYPANYSELRGFLIKAADLKAAQIEDVGPSQLGRLHLLPPGPGTNTGLLVEFRDSAGKALKSMLLGKEHRRRPERNMPPGEEAGEGWPDGRYVIAGANSNLVAVVSDPLDSLDVKPESWLSKDFFKVEKLRSIAVDFPEPTNSWKVTRESENGDWALTGAKPGEQLDSSKTSGFSSALSSPSFTDVIPGDVRRKTGLDKPTVISLETFDHFAYSLKVGEKTNDDFYLSVHVAADLPKERVPGKDEKAEDKDKLDKEFKDGQKQLAEKLAQEKALEPWVYLASSWTVDSLLKERSQLLAQPKTESGGETNKLETTAESGKPGSSSDTNKIESITETNAIQAPSEPGAK